MKKTFLILFLTGITCIQAGAQLIAPNPKKHKTSVEPILKTLWAQGDPFNLACPTYTKKKSVIGTTTTRHYAVGCVPLALGQIMNYHKYPAKGEGEIHRDALLGQPAIDINFGATTYDWNNMLALYPSAAIYNISTPSVSAVSTLLFHVGVAMGTFYQTTGSSTISGSSLKTSMAKYFNYDPDSMQFLKRSDYSKEQWMNIIFTELSKGRPIYYSGNSAKQGAHAWVIDGYNAEGKVHINWGWRGLHNNYYDVDLSTDDPNTDFVTNQAMMIGIVPKKTTTHIDAYRASEESNKKIKSIYTAGGTQAKEMQKGINIIRYSDGSTRKVMKK